MSTEIERKLPDLRSPFKSAKGEAEYMAAYEASMRLWAVPFEDMSVPSRFGITHLVVSGPNHAPALVLLHCFYTSLTSWAYNIADLSRNYRVYALDMMGQPSKSIPDQTIGSRDEMAEWLNAVLDQLPINEMDLVGYSYGGYAALNYAMGAPQRVRKLVLLTPVGALVPLKMQFFVRSMLTQLPGRFWTESMMRWFFHKPNLNDEKVRTIFDLITNQMYLGIKHFRPGKFVLPLPFKDDELQGVEPPTLLLVGEQEALYNPVRALARAQDLIPNVQAEIVAQAGHDLPVSKAETVNPKVLAFLNK
jgi:pimeloyl-ACP methyl ester carboxylesterase